MLSKKSLDMLEYNGYSFRQSDGQLIFKKAGTDRIGLIIIMIISLLFTAMLFVIQWWAGIGALVIGFLVFRPLVKRIPGKLALALNPKNEEIELDNQSHTRNFHDIRGVYIHSKFVDEYSSAFKSTSEEHQITIGLEEKNGNQIALFKMISDHAKPSKEMNEVHSFLQNTIQKQ